MFNFHLEKQRRASEIENGGGWQTSRFKGANQNELSFRQDDIEEALVSNNDNSLTSNPSVQSSLIVLKMFGDDNQEPIR